MKGGQSHFLEIFPYFFLFFISRFVSFLDNIKFFSIYEHPRSKCTTQTLPDMRLRISSSYVIITCAACYNTTAACFINDIKAQRR